MTCTRTAWLTLGSLTLPLEDDDAGYFCQSLDLGYPDVRAVVNNKPGQHGIDDRTSLMGGRTVTANITALAGAGAVIDEVATSFAPFMVPSARPVLHYVLDRPGAAERTLTLRGSGYSWPIVGADQRDIQLQWIAADPVVRDPTVQTATAWSGSSDSPGRQYNLTFNRIYPVGGGDPTTGIIQSPGDVRVRPLLRVYGPITGAQVIFTTTDASLFGVYFMSEYRIDAGHFVDVDTAAHSVMLDGTTSALSALDWRLMGQGWPVLPVLPAFSYMTWRARTPPASPRSSPLGKMATFPNPLPPGRGMWRLVAQTRQFTQDGQPTVLAELSNATNRQLVQAWDQAAVAHLHPRRPRPRSGGAGRAPDRRVRLPLGPDGRRPARGAHVPGHPRPQRRRHRRAEPHGPVPVLRLPQDARTPGRHPDHRLLRHHHRPGLPRLPCSQARHQRLPQQPGTSFAPAATCPFTS